MVMGCWFGSASTVPEWGILKSLTENETRWQGTTPKELKNV
jgi:hypothetical protein